MNRMLGFMRVSTLRRWWQVKRIHVYATPWDLAQEDYETVKFSTGGWWVLFSMMVLVSAVALRESGGAVSHLVSSFPYPLERAHAKLAV